MHETTCGAIRTYQNKVHAWAQRTEAGVSVCTFRGTPDEVATHRAEAGHVECCDRWWHDAAEARKHKRSHKVECDLCGDRISRGGIKRHQESGPCRVEAAKRRRRAEGAIAVGDDQIAILLEAGIRRDVFTEEPSIYHAGAWGNPARVGMGMFTRDAAAKRGAKVAKWCLRWHPDAAKAFDYDGTAPTLTDYAAKLVREHIIPETEVGLALMLLIEADPGHTHLDDGAAARSRAVIAQIMADAIGPMPKVSYARPPEAAPRKARSRRASTPGQLRLEGV